MKVVPPTRFLVWVFALLLALSFLVWTTQRRIQRIEYVSALPGRAENPDHVTSASPTGYANGQRELIVPERNEASYAWIEQTQRMLDHHDSRVHHTDVDNAPGGREVYSTSPYRWWLGLVSWADHIVSGRPLGLSVEHAALFADPVLHGLFLVAASVLVAWRFGCIAGAIIALGMATLFPLGAAFLPGTPDHHALARVLALTSALFVFSGLRAEVRVQFWFIAAGVLGGMALWVDAATSVLVLGGVFVGALAAMLVAKAPAIDPAPFEPATEAWRIWSLAGALTLGVAYLMEYFPSDLGEWRLQVIHPLYGIAWLGAGELLVMANRRRNGAPVALFSKARTRRAVRLLLSVAAIASVPLAMKLSSSDALFARDTLSFHLTEQPNGVVAANTWTWIMRDGMSGPVLATLLPLAVFLPLLAWSTWRSDFQGSRVAVAAPSGAVLTTLVLTSTQLAWWSLAEGLLLLGIVATMPRENSVSLKPGYRVVVMAVFAASLLAGVVQLIPGKKADSATALTAAEAQELIDRDLAHWLAKHSDEPGAIVYAPPHTTASLAFFGGLRGIGTFAVENRAGFGVSLMIAAANTLEEAEALLQTREVKYVVVPSWDPFFDNFAELYLDKRFAGRTSFLIGNLRRFNVPLWLRPVAYSMPEVSGYEGQSVLVFEKVEDQIPAVAAGRMVEYLIETGRVEQAMRASDELRRFPGDVGALTARAQLAIAHDDTTGLMHAVDSILERSANGGDRYLPWDRRVSLAIVLAQANKIDPARVQLRRCIEQTDTQKIRALAPGALYRLLVLSRALNVSFSTPELQRLALELLPSELRSRL